MIRYRRLGYLALNVSDLERQLGPLQADPQCAGDPHGKVSIIL